jgi:NDP-sugar pyrophosphorylase family protein
MKRRVSLSIEEEVINDIDSQIDGIKIRSRSDAVEKFLKEYATVKRTAVILAGGDPEKLFIDGLGLYRPLVDIGKRTLIEDIIIKCRDAGFSNIVIVAFPALIAKLYEVIGNGKKYDVNITYIEETKELGSGKTLELAKKHVGGNLLFLPCDHYFDFDLKKLYKFHLSQGGAVTLGINAMTTFDWKTSIVVLDGYKIVDYEEFPKEPKSRLISVFIGFMKKEIFNYIAPGNVYWSLQENIFPKLAKEGKLIGYPVSGNWVNIHDKQDIKKVINLIKNK